MKFVSPAPGGSLRAFWGLLWIILAPGLLAFQRPDRAALPDFDKRPTEAPSPAQVEAAHALETEVAGVRVDFDPLTGSPQMIGVPAGLLARASGETANSPSENKGQTTVDAAGDFVGRHQALFGFGSDALAEAQVVRDFVTAHNRLRTVVRQQQVGGVRVFEAVFISHTTASGELVNLSCQFTGDPARGADIGTPNWPTLLESVRARPEEAIVAAARHLDQALTASEIVQEPGVGVQPGALRLFRAPDLKGAAGARLTWLAMGRDKLRLCWEVILSTRAHPELYRVVLDAETGEVAVRHCLTAHISEATYRVYTGDSPSPLTPSYPAPSSSQPPLVPRVLLTLSALDTNASPSGWIEDSVNETFGNNVDAHTDTGDDDYPDLPRPAGSPFRVFDFPINLATQDPSDYSAASVVQLFYLCNWMHDRLYALGFTEAAGNFQTDNFGRGGLGRDAVLADAQDGGGFNNANMATPPDGMAPRLQMYLFNRPNPRRDGALDAEVVLHEYTHGLSNRRVGGGLGLNALQSRGLGEGWSDFYAMALLSEPADDPGASYATGGYISYRLSSGFDQNYYFGIRRFPYSTNLARNPLTLNDIDPVQADHCSSGAPHSPLGGGCNTTDANEVHNQGEVWCSTLWEARAALIAKHGGAAGNQLALQLVTDGMNLSPPNPNFVQARDGILQADMVNTGGANLMELWAAFAKRGLGFGAFSPPSSRITGILQAFDIPDVLQIQPPGPCVARGPVGGPFNITSRVYSLTNAGTVGTQWRVGAAANWLSLSQNGGWLGAGEGTLITATLNPAASALPAGIHTNRIWFTNLVTGVTQPMEFSLYVGLPDYFTRQFLANAEQVLAGQTFTFTPDGSPSFYSLCRAPASRFPTDPTSGTPLYLADDESRPLTLSNSVAIYGRRTNVVHVGSNGYLTLDSGDANFDPSTEAHFDRPRVSGVFDDLNPAAGGTISWIQLTNRLAVTFDQVPEYGVPFRTNSFQIELFYDGRIRMTFLAVKSLGSLTGLSAGNGIPSGFLMSDFDNAPICKVPLRVTLPASVREGMGLLGAAGELALIQPLPTNLVVTLESSRPGELSVQSKITVPAGQTNVSFDLQVQDDPLLNGTREVKLTASTPIWPPGETWLALLDNESANLLISAPATVVEGQVLTATVLASIAPAADIPILLYSSRPDQLTVPGSVTLPAGQTAVAFSVAAVDDGQLDGPVAVTLRAHVPNWPDGTAPVTVLDNETAEILVALPVWVDEFSAPLPNAGRVSISGALATNLDVELQSSIPWRLDVPPSVTILAGRTNAYFTLTPLDNTTSDGDEFIAVIATAPAFVTGSAQILIKDDEHAPVITTQPVAVAATEGDTAVFSVVAAGLSPLSYQWNWRGAPILGATDSTLVLSNVQTNQAGPYSVEVSNPIGTTASTSAWLTVALALNLGDVVDQPTWSWDAGGNAPWFPQTIVAADGLDAAQSGPISHFDVSWLRTFVNGPGTLNFSWKVSSEPNFDTCALLVDDSVMAEISGEMDWQPAAVSIPAGVHEVKWRYSKNASVSAGLDRAWVDLVSFVPQVICPAISKSPAGTPVAAGTPLTLCVEATGTAPLSYQWRHEGIALPGATGTCLTLPATAITNAGGYSVVVANSCGAVTSAVAQVTVLDLRPLEFKILALTTNNASVVEHDFVTGDDRGGIAVSRTRVYVTGDTASGRFDAANLSGGTPLDGRFDALVADLLTGRIYSLAAGTNALNGGGTADRLLEHDPNTGALTGNSTPLSTPILLPGGGGGSGVFSGYGWVLLHNRERAYCVWLASGVVVDLGAMPELTHANSETWAYWGVAEYFSNAFHLVYVSNSTAIVRTRVPDGATTTLAQFQNLGDMASFVVSPWNRRWYFHYEGTSQFGTGFESLGTAEARTESGVRLPPPVLTSGALVFRIPTAAGRTHVLEYTDSLSPPQWTTLFSWIGDGTAQKITQPPGLAARRFYRLRVE